ncbi:MAG: YihY/virulence factor BrkB family protein [Rubrivivax sp.]
MKILLKAWYLLRDTVNSWIDDKAPSMGAALAFYTLFSVAPLLLIAISVAGLVFGEQAARGEILAQASGLLGATSAQALQSMLEEVNRPGAGIVGTVVGVVTLLIGATTVFGELQSALDRIWSVPEQPSRGGAWSLVRARLLSLGLILGIGFLLMVSLVASAALAALSRWWAPFFERMGFVPAILDLGVSVTLITVLFAMIYKLMPSASVAWRDVWIGSILTAALFTIGKFLIALYIGRSGVASPFGAAGSVVVLLMWVYFSAQIFLLGAEFTWVYANRHGSRKALHPPDAPESEPRT